MDEINKTVKDFTMCIELYFEDMEETLMAIDSRFCLPDALVKLGQNVKVLEHLNMPLESER